MVLHGLELRLSERDTEIVRIIASQRFVKLKDLEDYLMEKYNIGLRGAYKCIKQLVDRRILKFSRLNHTIYVELHPDFLGFIVEIYNLALSSQADKIRYHKQKLKKKR